MKIPDSFSRLSSATLVVAAGTFDARVYLLQNGRVVEDEQIRKDRPTYSDNEGFFARRSEGGGVGGSVREDAQGQKIEKEFLQDLGHHMEEMTKGYAVEKVLVFAPAERLPKVREAVPSALKKKVFHVAPGSFYKQPITKLLQVTETEMESRRNDASDSMATEEARRILHRPR